METKWTALKVLEVIKECRKAGQQSAKKKLTELRGHGYKYNVVDESADEVVGKMFDVCGFAHLKITARGKFYLLAKKLSAVSGYRFMCHRGYYGGGSLSIFDCTRRQEMSVNIAACEGQKEVLAKYGIEASIVSRID